MPDEQVSALAARDNNFGTLRLLFAACVILSHSPELIDMNRSREILTRITGVVSLGEVAVEGFFLISGYLVTKSYVQSRSTLSYLLKRILRIVPGYFVCYWFCVLVIAPLTGADNPFSSIHEVMSHISAVLLLKAPLVPGAFRGSRIFELDGPIWTIAYEFRCYLAAALFGIAGFYSLQYRMAMFVVVLILLYLGAAGTLQGAYIAGISLDVSVRLGAMFGIGAIYYLLRDVRPLTNAGAIVAASLLLPMIFSPLLAELGVAIFGSYLIFWFALKVPVFRISRLTNHTDISYGLYLYGWPIQNLIIWSDKAINPLLLSGMTFVVAGSLAYASWRFIEKPSLRLGPVLTRGTAPR